MYANVLRPSYVQRRQGQIFCYFLLFSTVFYFIPVNYNASRINFHYFQKQIFNLWYIVDAGLELISCSVVYIVNEDGIIILAYMCPHFSPSMYIQNTE